MKCFYVVLECCSPFLNVSKQSKKQLRLLYSSFDKEFSNFRTHSSFFSKQTLVESCISITNLTDRYYDVWSLMDNR